MHSLIHCDDGDDSTRTRPDESVNDDNGDDLQDIADYVRDELQEELNLKGGDFVFASSSSSSEDYGVKQNDDSVEINHMLNDQHLVLINQKPELSKAEQIDMGGIVSNDENSQRKGVTYVIIFLDWHTHRNPG